MKRVFYNIKKRQNKYTLDNKNCYVFFKNFYFFVFIKKLV